jgi:hypothetical protein
VQPKIKSPKQKSLFIHTGCGGLKIKERNFMKRFYEERMVVVFSRLEQVVNLENSGRLGRI